MMFVFFALCLLYCQSKEKNNNGDRIDNLQAGYHCIDLTKLNRECLDIDSIIISSNIPIKSTVKELFSILGRPDTIIPVLPDFIHTPQGNLDSRVIYYKDIRYYTIKESAYIQSINFEGTDIQVTHPKIVLSKSTTIMDLQRVFPLSGYMLRGGGQTFNGFMELRTSKRWDVGAIWFLVFKQSKLIRLDFIEPY